MSETARSFFTIYDLALKRKRMNCSTLSKRLAEEEGVEISPRSLQRYRTKEMRPNFQVAKAIFSVLEISASDEQISDMLEFAREEKVKNYTASKYIERGVRIRTSLLSDEEKPDADIIDEMNARISKTQPEGHCNFNRYITDLIKYDMAHHVLPEVETGETTIEELIATMATNNQ